MNQETSWQTSNAQYLSIALAWLRAKLRERAGQNEEPAIAVPETESAPANPQTEPAPQSKGERRRREPASESPGALAWLRAKLQERAGQNEGPAIAVSETESAPAGPQTEPAPPLKGERRHREPASESPGAGADNVTQLAAQMASIESKASVPPALIMLARSLGLSRFECETLLLCAAMELDTGIASLCARAQADLSRAYPTFALAFTLFDTPAWDALSPHRPLRHWRLIEINQPAGLPLTTSPLRADERIVNYIKGLNYLDDRLAPLLTPLELRAQPAEVPSSQQRSADIISDHLRQAGDELPVVQLLGAESSSKQLVAAHAAKDLGLIAYRLQASVVPAQAPELETLCRLWQRESMLVPLALYIDPPASETDAPEAGYNAAVNRLISRTSGLVFVDTREPLPGLRDNSLRIDIAKPTSAEQQELWAAALGEASGTIPASLAAQFNLSVPAIRQIASRAVSDKGAADTNLHDRLWAACQVNTRPRLDMLAQRVETKAGWQDIVLQPAEMGQLKQIAAHVAQRIKVHEDWGFARRMSRGLGISALFAGDSGTGKTMAAEVMANELHLHLYRIDLSAVVSKYIGETEKNLRRVFDAAEDGGAILFFDEADALFGRRSEVKDSHDRYANIEINYLLQRMEAYGGLAILATNRQNALDAAFMRRLRFVVNFAFPGAAQRRTIWEKVFPKETPVEDLDFDRLARLNLTGGNISSIALNAAFQAAHAAQPVSMPLILESARAELRKQGRVINELEFRSVAKAVRAA